jgi:F0F1-type ATP synthase alpha subunit
MEIRAAEISDILKKQIAEFGAQASVAEVGQVLSVGDGVARVHGLDQCPGWRNGRVPRRHQGHGPQSRNRQCRARYFR